MEATTSDHAADIDRHVRVYITVFVALMVLTVVTVAISIAFLITLLTGRSIWYSGARQVLVGLIAAAITFGIGRIIGVTIAG